MANWGKWCPVNFCAFNNHIFGIKLNPEAISFQVGQNICNWLVCFKVLVSICQETPVETGRNKYISVQTINCKYNYKTQTVHLSYFYPKYSQHL